MHAALTLLALAIAISLAYSILVTPTALRRTNIDAPIEDLAPEFDGYTIAVLSDIHYGGTFAPAKLIDRAVRLVNEASPDLTVLLGDYALSHSLLPTLSRLLYEWALPRMSVPLRALRARDGVFAVLGNHDYDYNASRVAAWLRDVGARVLVNECVLVVRGGAQLAVGGVDDWTHGHIDPAGGCGSIPAGIPRVILSHNPDGALELRRASRVDLVLAGHTHGGQLVLPWYGAPSRHCTVCDRHCASGWVRRAPVPLYVTSGVGVVLPLRVNSPAEVLIVRLVGR